MKEVIPELTIEEKRQVVYSSLCRYAAEAVPLRQRAIRRVVLGALVGSTKTKPFRVGNIKENLSFGSLNLEIRTEIIQDTLERLIQEELVSQGDLRERHAYYLTQAGEAEISTLTVSITQLFQEVENRLFRDISEFLSPDITSQIFRRFTFECFARFGLQIAKTTTGTISREELARRIDARAAFEVAIDGYSLSTDQRESLSVRCHRFLTSVDPAFERLKFCLTQGYYFTQLVGLEHAKFNPLAEQAFFHAAFYLDTNVLLVGLLYLPENESQFIEMIGLAQRLGIELRVTRATIDETKRVISDRMPEIRKIIDVLPHELAEKTNDQILKSYYRMLDANPSFTPDEFLQSIAGLDSKLRDEWHIIIDEHDATDLIAGRDVATIQAVMNEEAVNSRGRRKSPLVLQHDAAHFLLVTDQRGTNPKTWFLTRDRSLEAVSSRLQPEEPSFAFSHIGFLHSLSPFVSTAREEMSLADVMSAFMIDQIRPIENLFDLSELALMAEFHEDVMETPTDQLIMAFDYIKSRTLRGEQYREADIPRVSLELKKFLTADRNAQVKTLQEERQRLEDLMKTERDLRIAAEEKANQAIRHGIELEEELSALRSNVAKTQNTLDEITKTINDRNEHDASVKQRKRLVYGVIGVVCGILLVTYRLSISEYILSKIPILIAQKDKLDIALRGLSALIITIPSFNYIRNAKWTSAGKTWSISSIAVFVLAFTNLVSNETLSVWSSMFGVGTTIGLVIAAIFLIKKE